MKKHMNSDPALLKYATKYRVCYSLSLQKEEDAYPCGICQIQVIKIFHIVECLVGKEKITSTSKYGYFKITYFHII